MLLSEHAEAIEADLLRYYRLDLLDYHRGSMSARRLRVLVRHLPEDSALGRALRASGAGESTPGDAFLAEAVPEGADSGEGGAR
ncbi:hypothetical protein [Kitasatospora sp. HPMI-4]|uniref:hypothetical protein n=1 Tax=Kitasatospora sp. HPMI-4 TaxID=3448443 RepID=UPI003F1935E1